jgi:hypothetical protein
MNQAKLLDISDVVGGKIPVVKLTDMHIDAIVHNSLVYAKMLKDMEKNQNALKDILKQVAKSKKRTEFSTAEGSVTIGSSSSSEILPGDLLKLLAKFKLKNLFLKLVKVSVTEAKKYLPEEELAKVTKVDIVEYSRVYFKY